MTKWLQEQKWPEVKKYLEKEDLILLPVGSVEQHGFHLPLMTDTAQAIMVAEAVSEETGIMVAPPIWYGWAPHHLAYPGSVTLRPETLSNLIEDICLSLIYHGFDRIIVISGHRTMNLMPIDPTLVRIRYKTGAYVALIDLALIIIKESKDMFDSEIGGIGHACEWETSAMLYYRPDLVDMEKATETLIYHGTPLIHNIIPADPRIEVSRFSFYRTVEEQAKASGPSGAGGDGTKASAEKGRKILAAQVANTKLVIEHARNTDIKVTNRPLPV